MRLTRELMQIIPLLLAIVIVELQFHEVTSYSIRLRALQKGESGGLAAKGLLKAVEQNPEAKAGKDGNSTGLAAKKGLLKAVEQNPGAKTGKDGNSTAIEKSKKGNSTAFAKSKKGSKKGSQKGKSKKKHGKKKGFGKGQKKQKSEKFSTTSTPTHIAPPVVAPSPRPRPPPPSTISPSFPPPTQPPSPPTNPPKLPPVPSSTPTTTPATSSDAPSITPSSLLAPISSDVPSLTPSINSEFPSLTPSTQVFATVAATAVPTITAKAISRASPVSPATTPPSTSLSAAALNIAKFVQGINEFVPGSYQATALKYVESRNDTSTLSEGKAVQYYALACIYYATHAVANPATNAFVGQSQTLPGWLSKINWLSETVDPCSGSSSTTPVWTGVLCSDDKITQIDLSENFLTGSIPNEIALLSADHPSGAGNINYLDLYGNTYLFNSGDSGLSWIGQLGSNMQYLFFGSTSFVYNNGVPDFLSNLTSLQQFDCSYTYFSGPLRSAPFAPLQQLNYIELDGNAYNSSIPSVFATLPNLLSFYAADSFVSGDLSFMNGMSAIDELWVDKNSIGGSLPTFLGSLSTLTSFSVSKNLLIGALPTEINQLKSIKQLWLYSNKLSGIFPDSYTGLSVLKTFHAEDNLITGNATALCSALGPPLGALTSLGVDCGSSALVTLPSTCSIRCCSVAECGDDS